MKFSPLIHAGLARLLLISCVILSGCSSTPIDEKDPLEPFNREMFAINEDFDRKILKPTAEIYRNRLPKPVQTGINNFLSNIDDAFVVINDILQFKLAQAVSDLSRLVWNSTAGLAGLVDVATPMGLPKHNEDLGQTLGVWGIGDSPYLVLPFIGPSTLRDTTGVIVQSSYHPVNDIDDSKTYWASVVLIAANERARLLGASSIVEEAALDRYVFIRDAYLQHRLNLVHDGKPPKDKLKDGLGKEPSKEELELERELEMELERDLQSPSKP